MLSGFLCLELREDDPLRESLAAGHGGHVVQQGWKDIFHLNLRSIWLFCHSPFTSTSRLSV